MKSRTSSFNLTVFKKDLTRFAPAWAAYLIVLLMTLILVTDGGDVYYRVRNMRDFIIVMGWFNLFYAPVVAQLLFGDLYNSRLCNALHAMPITREGWFVTHVASGLAFSFLPNLFVVLLGLPLLQLEAGWSAVFWWLLGAGLQYLFFFGAAVLCVMLTGNRLGQLAMYAIINGAGALAYFLAGYVYQPLLHGIQISAEPFYLFCPVARFSQMENLLIIDSERIEDEFGGLLSYEVHGVAPGTGWGYLAVCAALGILALVAALALYRKRDLECAGDFVAFRKTEPAVLVLVTVCVSAFFHLFGDLFGMNLGYVLLYTGMIVGFFGCRMLMERTTRVFRKKTFLSCGAIVAVFSLTLVLTWLDPAGITRYVPELDEVESVTFSEAYSLHRHDDYPFTATDAEDIQALLDIHSGCIDQGNYWNPYTDTVWNEDGVYYSEVNLRLEYKLKNGRTVNRFYEVHPMSEAGQVLKSYYTQPECVLGFPEEQARVMTDYIRSIYVDGMTDGQQYDLDHLDLDAMMDAILADCAAGNLAQNRQYHYPNNYDFLDAESDSYDMGVCYLEIGWDHDKWETALQGNSEAYGIISYSSIRIYRSCENTLKWLEDNNLLTEDMQKEMAIKFGGPTAVFETNIG